MCAVLFLTSARILRSAVVLLCASAVACQRGDLDSSKSVISTGRVSASLEKRRPERASDVWSDEVWAAHLERVSRDLGQDALVPSREGYPAYIPLDPSLLDRLTFVSVPVSDLKRLLRTWKPAYIPDQPFGATGFTMWPRIDSHCFLWLRLEWEANEQFVPVVIKESIEKTCGGVGN